MSDRSVLSDTNILLRENAMGFAVVPEALRILRAQGAVLCCTSQTLAEFWNVSTRPVGNNGMGLSIAETNDSVSRIETSFTLLPDSLEVHREWRRLVFTYEVRGAKVHDARLVATMNVHGVRRLLTLNPTDFHRYPGIQVLTPKDVLAAP